MRAFTYEEEPSSPQPLTPLDPVDAPISGALHENAKLVQQKAAKLGFDLEGTGEWNFMGTLGAGSYGRMFGVLIMN